MSDSNVGVTGFNNSNIGKNTLTVLYKGKSTTFKVSIVGKITLADAFVNEGFKIKKTFVHGFTLNDSMSTIKKKINLDYISNGSGVISTGIDFKYNSEIFTAVIYGDLNGDGKINSADLLKMRQHLLGTSTLTGAYKEAALIASGTSINSADLLRIRQHLLGERLIKQ